MKTQISTTIRIKRSITSYIDNILVYIFFALTLYIYLFNYDVNFLYVRYVFLALAAIRGYYICTRKKFWMPFLIALFITVNYFICFFYQQSVNLSFTNYTYTILYIGLAVLLLEESYGLLGSGILLIFCIGVILLRYLQGVKANNILTYTSRNYISVLVLFVLILFYLALYKYKEEGYLAVLVPAFIFMIICAVGYGRGGIITAAFLLIALLLYKSFESQNTWEKRIVRIIAFAIIMILVIYLIYNSQSFFLGRFTTVGATDDARLSYWTTFLHNNTKSVTDLFLGSNTSLIRADKNLHNSFLQCYASYGLISFIGLVIMCIRAYIKGLKGKDYFVLILMSTLLIRSITDRLFFQGYCEVLLYYFLLYWDYREVNYKNSD